MLVRNTIACLITLVTVHLAPTSTDTPAGPEVARVAPTVVEYRLPRPGAFPHDPAVASDGTVWYTDQANSFIGRLDPASGKITDWPTPTPKSGPHGLLVAPDGAIWYTANSAGHIGRLDPATGRIKEYELPAEARDPHTPVLRGDMLWFTAQRANLIGRLDTKTGEVKLFPVATPHALPYGIVPTADGNGFWVALFGTNKIAHVVAATGVIHEIELPNTAARPRRLVVDGKGRVWFSDFGDSKLGLLDPATRTIKEFDTPDQYGKPYGIAVGPDGRIWYEESSQGKVVAFDPATQESEVVAIPTSGAIVRNMAVDAEHGRIWLALSGTGRLGRIDVAGARAAAAGGRERPAAPGRGPAPAPRPPAISRAPGD